MRSIIKRYTVLVVAITMILSTLSLGSSSFAAPGDPDDWSSVGVPDFASSGSGKPSTAIYNGTPYVAFEDATQSFEASVMRYNGTAWEYVGAPGFTADDAADISITISGGTPYVTFIDYANSRHISVMRYNGTAWEYVGAPGFSAGMAYVPTITAYNGTPYVAYIDDANGGRASVMRYNGTAWEYVGAPGFSAGMFSNIALAVYEGTPYVTYDDCSHADCYTSVMRYNGTAWEHVGESGFTDDYTVWNSLAFDDEGTPYVAFVDSANGFETSVMRYNGTAWEHVGTPGFSEGEADYVSFVIHDNVLYVAYADYANSRHASVMRYNGTAWEYVGTPGFSGSIAREGLTLVSDTDSLYVANTSANFVMKYDLVDATASNTLALSNSENGGEIFIETPESSSITCGTAEEESPDYDDKRYVYPLGLANFCFTTSNVDNEVSLTFVTNLAPSQVTPRRYDPRTRTYANIPGVVINSVVHNGQNALRVTYTISDNSSVDIDAATGIVSDYIGLARLVEDAEILAPNAGVGKPGVALPVVFSIGAILIVAIAASLQFRMRTKS